MLSCERENAPIRFKHTLVQFDNGGEDTPLQLSISFTLAASLIRACRDFPIRLVVSMVIVLCVDDVDAAYADLV